MLHFIGHIFWLLLEPLNFFLSATCTLSIASIIFPNARGYKLTLLLVSLIGMCIWLTPFPKLPLRILEERFQFNKNYPSDLNGIICLGGIFHEGISATRLQPTFTNSPGRAIMSTILARQFPKAKLVFTGGSPKYLNTSEGALFTSIAEDLGIEHERIIIEPFSRNTYENAKFTKNLILPQPHQHWILVTSAHHMPRAIATFLAAGWHGIIPYPVDFRTTKRNKEDSMHWQKHASTESFLDFSLMLHEWIGLIVYRITGRSKILFPSHQDLITTP